MSILEKDYDTSIMETSAFKTFDAAVGNSKNKSGNSAQMKLDLSFINLVSPVNCEDRPDTARFGEPDWLKDDFDNEPSI